MLFPEEITAGMSSLGTTARVVSLDDPVDLLLLTETSNPFTSSGGTFDRQLLDEHCALLIAGSRDQPTCLYLWTIPLHDVTLWLGYAGAWLRHYPRWRRLHGLPPTDRVVNVVLAAPDFSGVVRTGLEMLARPVTLARYTCFEVGALRSLCWEGGAIGTKHSSETIQESGLSMEEISFFRRPLPSS